MQYQIFQSPELYIFDIMFNFPREEHSLIYNEKKNIEQKYGIQPRSSSVPHITLCSFLVLSDRNERIIANLKEKLRKMKAIKVSLNGYDVFSNNVVYAKLEPKKSFNPYFKC